MSESEKAARKYVGIFQEMIDDPALRLLRAGYQKQLLEARADFLAGAAWAIEASAKVAESYSLACCKSDVADDIRKLGGA